jgi:hypothetical protein
LDLHGDTCAAEFQQRPKVAYGVEVVGDSFQRLVVPSEYVYYDEECWLLFVWDGSVTVNIWQVTADGLYAFAVFTCGSDNPTTQTVRASILGYLARILQ